MNATVQTSPPKFLYGAAVQGIQDFIFRTNDLKDIVGASEIVEEVCTSAFKELLGDEFCEEDVVVMAAGNIKYAFRDEALCRKAVREFPRKVMEMAPGITLSEAVVPYGANYAATVQELERRLRIQRNRPFRSPTLGSIGVLHARKTGAPVVAVVGDEYLDESTLKKVSKCEEAQMEGDRKGDATLKLSRKMFGDGVTAHEVAFNISDICDRNNWIAVVHADGNGLGQVVQRVGGDAKKFREFSKQLDVATTTAARNAYLRLCLPMEQGKPIPIRPIVLNGDDLTLVCRADLAVELVKCYLDEFELATGRDLTDQSPECAKALHEIMKEYQVFANGKNYLTACAGISFIKSSYPFYYGYNLAETLCGRAKKESKEISGGMEKLPPSSLFFHKVQSSFIEDFAEIKRKELTMGDVTLDFGPYYLSIQDVKDLLGDNCFVFKGTQRRSIKYLQGCVDKLDATDAGRALKSNLRDWLTILSSQNGAAQQRGERIISQVKDADLQKWAREVLRLKRTPIYDILSLYSIQHTETINKETSHESK
jgi:hypothetical protein